MPPEKDPTPDRSRPWWTGSARNWESPWDLDDALEDKAEAHALEPDRVNEDERVHRELETAMVFDEDEVEIEAGQPMAEPVSPRVLAKPQQESRVTPIIDRGTAAQPMSGLAGEEAAGEAVKADDRWKKEPEAVMGWGRMTIMALLVLALTFMAWQYLTDIKEVDDGDLRLQLPLETDGTITTPQRMEAFLESLRGINSPGLRSLEPWEWDVNDMRAMLNQNGLALDNLKDLLEDQHWSGRHVGWNGMDLGAHPNWEIAALLKQVEIAYNERRGNEAAALASAMDLAELARRLQDLYAWPSFFFRSLEIHRRCAESLAELLQRSRLPALDLAGFQEQFEACAPNDQQVRRNVLPGFYLFEKKVLLGMQSGEPFEAMPAGVVRSQQRQLFFKGNETLDLIAGSVRYLINQVGQTSASSAGLRDMWASEPVGRGLNAYLPNGKGVAFAQERLQPYLDVPARQQLAKTRHLLVVQLLAMRRFIADHHGLPGKLGDLRPMYLKDLPLDPFSGDPFQYDPLTRVIYSVGSDYVASGGRPQRPPLSDPGEPTVKIGVRTATAER
jgi:hypothetical protein